MSQSRVNRQTRSGAQAPARRNLLVFFLFRFVYGKLLVVLRDTDGLCFCFCSPPHCHFFSFCWDGIHHFNHLKQVIWKSLIYFTMLCNNDHFLIPEHSPLSPLQRNRTLAVTSHPPSPQSLVTFSHLSVSIFINCPVLDT